MYSHIHRGYGEHYSDSVPGQKADVESRAKRAYQALRHAEKARQELSTHPQRTQFEHLIRHLTEFQNTYKRAHEYLTGSPPHDELPIARGAQLAAHHLPFNADKSRKIRTLANRLADNARSTIRDLRYAKDCGEFDDHPEAYEEFRSLAIWVLGNAEAVCDAVDTGFQEDVAVFLQEIHQHHLQDMQRRQYSETQN